MERERRSLGCGKVPRTPMGGYLGQKGGISSYKFTLNEEFRKCSDGQIDEGLIISEV